MPFGFAHPGYAFALTRQASDDIAFIARWMKICIIVAIVLMSLYLVLGLLVICGLFFPAFAMVVPG